MYRGYWWGTLTERDHCEDIGVDRRIILEWIFKKFNGQGLWTSLMMLRIGRSVGLL